MLNKGISIEDLNSSVDPKTKKTKKSKQVKKQLKKVVKKVIKNK